VTQRETGQPPRADDISAESGDSTGDAPSRSPLTKRQHTDRQKLLLANVERMGEMRVSDAMVPRADIVGIEMDSTYAEVIAVFRQEGHSRLPVYGDTLDDAEGFVHVKDVFMLAGQGDSLAMPDSFALRDFLRRILTVPPSMRCGVLLQKMQADRVHMCWS